ncbi:hypothetical protein C8R47DRAFT_961290 [Mycena vitilis]|nr:hypothetical protein C8R47DRAFT_961290 [Mycena vitilis]
MLPEASSEDGSRSVNGNKQCSHCRATSTPAWRRDPRTHKTLCNACGVYLSQHHQRRPQKLIDVDNEVHLLNDDDLHGPQCSNCGTRRTSTWRRNKAREQVCNACGVYERSNGRPRPSTLRTDKTRPREKH